MPFLFRKDKLRSFCDLPKYKGTDGTLGEYAMLASNFQNQFVSPK
jgi:hypothetical protein